MIQRQLKLKLNQSQAAMFDEWLWYGTGIFNFAIRKIQQDAADGIYYNKKQFQNLLAGHAKKLNVPGHLIQGILTQAFIAWDRCFKKIAKRPKLKGARNKLNSLPFPDPIKTPVGYKIRLPIVGQVRIDKQKLPDGPIKNGRVIKRASGWYLALTIDAEPNIKKDFHPTNNDYVGIDPGFNHLLSYSNGKKQTSPKELNLSIKRIGQAQRGGNKKLAARINERIANRKKDRNHKLSRRLVEENQLIVFSKDNINGIKAKFGKSVANANHYQLRQMLAYKSSLCGRKYIEVDSQFSTKTCSSCGEITDVIPRGFAGLSVRQWDCAACGSHHDRDVNAAINTLIAGVGSTHEKVCHVGGSVRNHTRVRGSQGAAPHA